MITIELLTECALRVEEADPIDFGNLTIREEDAFRLMSHHVLEILNNTPPEQRALIMAASVVKLLVENFVLEAQKLRKEFD